VAGDPNLFREFLREFSSNTGGRAAVLTNTYDRSLDRLFEDTASYYLIGFAKLRRDNTLGHPWFMRRFRRWSLFASGLSGTVVN
jgi:hypothetical protein